MADARLARDAVRVAMGHRHDMTVALEGALIDLDGEVAMPSSPESAGWVALAQSQLGIALTACDAVRGAIVAAQAETAKLAAAIDAEENRG